MDFVKKIHQAQTAAVAAGQLNSKQKNRILSTIAKSLEQKADYLSNKNRKDVRNAEKHLAKAKIDRLTLTPKRIKDMVSSIRKVVRLPDPIGQTIDSSVRRDGLKISRVRVPIGVIAMIYESRPNVTVDAAVLAIKSGNAVILRGGSDAILTNKALVKIINGALTDTNADKNIVQLIASTDRRDIRRFLQSARGIDCIIPRGSKQLVDYVKTHARAPVIETGASIVHLYIDKDADLRKALDLIVNSKTRRVSTCNAADVVLVHNKIAAQLLPRLAERLIAQSKVSKDPLVELRVDSRSQKYLANYPKLTRAIGADYDTEFLDYISAIKVVSGLEEALEQIAEHSLKHSEGIVTENKSTAARFLETVDAACVFHNASTQFSDGEELGLGAEIGISTQKLHVRGPFALEGLTTYKWIVEGFGHIRP